MQADFTARWVALCRQTVEHLTKFCTLVLGRHNNKYKRLLILRWILHLFQIHMVNPLRKLRDYILK